MIRELARRVVLCAAAWFALFGEPAAHAGRTVYLPAYTRRAAMPDVLGGVPPDGTPVGAILHLDVNLTNLSTVSQTGTISLVSGTAAYGQQPYRGNFNAHWALCGGTTVSSDAPNFAAQPMTATWSLAAGKSTSVRASVFFTSTFNMPGPSGNTALDATFTPVIEVTINEDRGAVIASMVPNYDGPVPGYNLCDGTPFTGYKTFMPPNERTGVPVLVNGGRAF